MVVLGTCGVLDHSGVRAVASVPLPWLVREGSSAGEKAGSARRWGWVWVPLYDAREHDLHHELVNVNFGFPTMLLDRLCGTYAPPESRLRSREQGDIGEQPKQPVVRDVAEAKCDY